jgi:hypothetical protein
VDGLAHRFDVNDVSWLFPPPLNEADIGKQIALSDLIGEDGNPIVTDDAFNTLLNFANGDAGQAGEFRISVADELRDKTLWKIAAFRIDPSAPGTSDEMRSKFVFSFPQLRLICQPVQFVNNRILVRDMAIHLIFNYAKLNPESIPPIVSDNARFSELLDDVDAIKASLASRGIVTQGKDLNVHPGLADESVRPETMVALRRLLNTHLKPSSLRAMAIMGLPAGAPEPWIFLAVGPHPVTQKLVPVPSPGQTDISKTAQALSFFPGKKGVFPAPSVNNLNPPTGSIFDAPPRKGVSTAVLFDLSQPRQSPAIIGHDEHGNPMTDPGVLNEDIPNIVANPQMSHFFNTDCVSCHTETTRRDFRRLTSVKFAFNREPGVSGLSDDVKPVDEWNVRNFGWFQHPFGDGAIKATATVRTANETADVVAFINSHFPKKALKP